MPQGKLYNLDWPMSGLVQNTPYEKQPPDSSTDCLNVRPFDTLEARQRGGKRPGLSRYIADAVDGTNIIQGMETLTEALDPNAIVVDTLLASETYTALAEGAKVGDDTTWAEYQAASDTQLTRTTDVNRRWEKQTDSGNEVAFLDDIGSNSDGERNNKLLLYLPELSLGTAYIIKATITRPGGAASASDRGAIMMCARLDKATLTALADGATASSQAAVTVGWQAGSTDGANVQVKQGDGFFDYTNGTDVGSTFGPPAGYFDIELHANGNSFSFYQDGNLVGSWTSAVNQGNNGIAIFADDRSDLASSTTTPFVRSVSISTGLTPASLRSTSLVAVSGGDVYHGNRTEGLVAAVSGSSVVQAGVLVGLQAAFQDVFMCDGLSANYVYFDGATNTVKDWATDITGGSLPAGSVDTTLGCRIIALYRGRIVMSALEEDPQNWFMSAVDDPFDFDYSPSSPSATQAVAGNNAEAGLLGDVITALAPYNDDIMVMGGVNTLWLMRGDPAAGGAIDNISHNIGIVGPDAWCFDTVGNFYFVGLNGFYRMPAGGGQPELVSQGKLDKIFRDLDVEANRVFLAYDQSRQGVHIFISPINEPTTSQVHYWWDERTNSFWPESFPASQGPIAVHAFYGDDPDDTAVLLGGYDSFIRRLDDSSFSDDGTAITSYMRFAPIHPGMNIVNSRISDINILTDKGSEDTTFNVFVGHSVEDAEDQADADTVRFSRPIKGGRNQFFRNRVAGNAFIPEITQTSSTGTWAYETGSCKVELLGRIKGRGV